MSLLLRTIRIMSRCTAPIKGHRTASAAAACPRCGGYGSYSPRSYSPPGYQPQSGTVSASPTGAGSAAAGRRVDRAPQLGAGGSILDLLVFMVVLHRWESFWTISTAMLVLLLMLPFLIGLDLLSKCRAWINDRSRRCEQPRKGFLHRCVDHRSQPLTMYDVAGVLSILIGVVNVLVLIGVPLGVPS